MSDDFVDQAKLEAEFAGLMGQVETKSTLSFVFVNHTTRETNGETMSIDDVMDVDESKTVIVGREYGTGLLTKITIEYPELQEKEEGK